MVNGTMSAVRAGCSYRLDQQRQFRGRIASACSKRNGHVLIVSKGEQDQGSSHADTQKNDRDAVLSRIQKAKQYKQASPKLSTSGAITLAESSEAPGRADVVTRFYEQADVYAQTQEKDFLLAQQTVSSANKQQGSTDTAGPLAGASNHPPPSSTTVQSTTSDDNVNETARTRGTGRGSATEAANYLRTITTNSDSQLLDTNLRPEEFTLMKEELKKQREVEIISIDKNYRPDVGKYKPKVATWGVFPRPDNISQAFGGGRNLRPGQAYETEEEAEARKKRVAEALSRYKTEAGLILEPEVEAASQSAYDEGMTLFNRGRLEPALIKFGESADLLNPRTRLGGQALLQKAICLDSLGRNDEAYAIYAKIARHPAPGVAKSAKRMMFGFQAMKSLKTHTISYSVSKGAYEQYFRRLSSDWNTAYFSTEEDASLLPQIVLASLVISTPLLLVAIKIWVL